MTFPKSDTTYWNNKLAAYLHDPIDKVFRIQGHEERAARQQEVLGLDKPNEPVWKKADAIASGFERGQVPSYSSKPERNGAINFGEFPVITHPTSRDSRMDIDLHEAGSESFAEFVSEQLITYLEKEIGMKPGVGGYSDKAIFCDNPDAFAYARFLYLHQGLRFKLAEDNVAGLGGLWHRLPADSRFPDHTIWQHNALTSALYSCMDLAKNNHQVGILAFSITPVQPFIAKARKLRDYWTGSVLLSWLAFEGIRWIMENLGPDHILYPSPVDQPLVNEYLQKSWGITEINSLSNERKIASLPNKILCLIPLEMADEIAQNIKKQINFCWNEFCETICDTIIEKMKIKGDHLSQLFKRQCHNYWELQSTAVKLLEKEDIKEAQTLLYHGAMNSAIDVYNNFSGLVQKKWHTSMDARGLLYSNSHQMAQIALAASKAVKTINRPQEPGQKCHLCAEFDVLHDKQYTSIDSAKAYSEDINEFWTALVDAWQSEADLDGKEKLCALCLTKRIAYRVMKENKNHILHTCFEGAESFPSTTEMALHDEFKREQIYSKKEKQKIAQKIYENNQEQEVENRDRYYAVLVMDGDHMGRLINGETIGSTWASAMHPVMKKRLKTTTFESIYRDAWAPIFKNKRLVTPSIHSAMSEALGDFSIYGVANIVKNNEGRLIYAGGDDVCAVMPVSTVVQTAREISELYNTDFNLIDAGEIHRINERWTPVPGKLSVSLGVNKEKNSFGKNEEKISISAGILVCHHKENLSHMIAGAHNLLDTLAKEKPGRNACAIELRKRSGGSRYFVRDWNDNAWNSFQKIGQWTSAEDCRQVSKSLVYRLALFKDGFDAILKREDSKKYLVQFVAKQLERSSIDQNIDIKKEIAPSIVDLILAPEENGSWMFKPEGLIVAAFMAENGK